MEKGKPIYLDYASTTPVDPRVLEVMLPYFSEKFGNPASTTHLHGEEAKQAVDKAQKQVADLINAEPEEIIFTSGSTESINMALKGCYWANKSKSKHIITVKTEHKAVLDTCAWLEEIGAEVTYLDVDEEGIVKIDQYKEALKENPLLVCIMYANNETGVLQDIKELAKLAQEADAVFFTDATQAFGKIPLDVLAEDIDMMCFSAHKIYGPKGIGGLYAREGIKLTPLIHGGGHQNGFRSGTLNVPGIVGMGMASLIALKEMGKNYEKTLNLKTYLEKQLIKSGKIKINGKFNQRLPYLTNIQLLEEDADQFILQNKNNISISTGSACNSEVIEQSHVLDAMNIPKNTSSIRITLNNKIILNLLTS